MTSPISIVDPMIGQRVNRYVIRRKLVEGGMGAVYLATHEELDGMVKVVKTLLPVYAGQEHLRDRFKREAMAVSRLHHKHIITLDDFGQLPDGRLYLMMPFLKGQTLEEFLLAHGNKMSPHLALHIVVQVCSALQHMHDAGIVHRDVKPGNVFLVDDESEPYRVVLIDLGLAKRLDERERVTGTGAAMGTPAYMAVEQYTDAAKVTLLADVYAVAIMMWELLTGALPWGMHPAAILYQKQKDEPLARPAMMSQTMYQVLVTALAVRPEARHESMRALAIALAACVEGIPHAGVPSGAEIVARLARWLVAQTGPDDETIRKHSDGDRPAHAAPIHWPPRAPALAPVAVTQLKNAPAPAVATPVLQVTTLSASTGMASVGASSRGPSSRGAAVVGIIIAAVLLGVAVNVGLRGGSAAPAAAQQSFQVVGDPVPSDAQAVRDASVLLDATTVGAGSPIDSDAAAGGLVRPASAGEKSANTPPSQSRRDASIEPAQRPADVAAPQLALPKPAATAPARTKHLTQPAPKYDPNDVGGD